MRKVFHGATRIVDSPLCHIGRDNLDFGKGFYITDIRKQAISWATRVVNIGLPQWLNVYELDENYIKQNARCKVFTAYDEEWLDFIIKSRDGKKPWRKYDYVEGGIANDRVIDTVNLYMTGFYDAESALQQLIFHKPNNQICLLNQDFINKYLVYNGTEKI